MVTKTNHTGFREWAIQRITAIIIGAYTLTLGIYLLSEQPITYLNWYHFFHHIGIKIFTVITLLCVLWHAWIGLWTIFTDYVKPKPVRYVLEVIVILSLLAFVIWSIFIMW